MTNPFPDGAHNQTGVDAMFLVLCAFIIFTMHSGFGLFESGLVSSRSTASVWVINFIDVVVGGVAYWFVGYGFSFGEPGNEMAGNRHFITDVKSDESDAHVYVLYFLQLAFACTSTTIVSGAVGERVKIVSWIIFATIYTGLIYVFPCHWVWAESGWLYGKAQDFAGSGVVHMAGGAAAFAAALVLKPRIGRYAKDPADRRDFSMASPENTLLGTMFLWWGWIGFNCSSTLAVTGTNWTHIGRVAVVTMNGGLGGGVSALLYNIVLSRWRNCFIDIGEFTAGILGGLVGVTAGANVIRPWEGLLVGAIGAIVAILLMKLLNILEIDDPVGCIGVHYGAGLWGMIAIGFFADNGDPKLSGIFRNGSGELLGWNMIATLVITLWIVGLSLILFTVLKYTIGIRLDEADELKGADAVLHDLNNGNNDEKGEDVVINNTDVEAKLEK